MTVCLNEETIQAYIDGELAADGAAAVLMHLNGCTICAATACEVERAAILINSVFDDELPENVPSVNLRARLEDTLAQTVRPAVAGHSFGRHIYNLVSVRLRLSELSPLRLGLAVTVVIVAVILAGGLARNFWSTSEQKKDMVRKRDVPLPTLTPPIQDQVHKQRPELANSGNRNMPKRVPRRDQLAHSIKPKATLPEAVGKIEPLKTISIARYSKLVGNRTLRNPETNEHLRQTQLLLRSFRNTSIGEAEAAFDLTYEKRLSRELLSKNKLFRRSAENKEDSQTKELLNQLEPLLLDIANLPDKPSQDEVLLIKELIREQKIIATLQIYTARAGF